MPRRSPEEVHEQDGHAEFVASCRLCATEAEHDRNAAEARAELVEESLAGLATGRTPGGPVSAGEMYVIGDLGPEPPPIYQVVDEPPRRRGECIEDGCTNNGTHRGGRCCGCHSRPGRTA